MPRIRKTSKCTVCQISMRSDHLSRHMKVHTDLLSLPVEEVKVELRLRHAAQVEREAKQQQIKEIAEKEGLPIPQEILDTQLVDKDTVRKEMKEENQQYIEKIELGRIVAAVIHEEHICEQALCKEKQEALLLFRRQQPLFDISNTDLRPWQQDAMKYFESPTERQVIRISGRQGNEGKSWFQNYVQTFFGYHRVCRFDLRIKHANVCNVLKK